MLYDIYYILCYILPILYYILYITGPADSKKRRVDTVDWASGELPCIPILINPKALPKNTRLCVYQPAKTKGAKDKDAAK